MGVLNQKGDTNANPGEMRMSKDQRSSARELNSTRIGDGGGCCGMFAGYVKTHIQQHKILTCKVLRAVRDVTGCLANPNRPPRLRACAHMR